MTESLAEQGLSSMALFDLRSTIDDLRFSIWFLWKINYGETVNRYYGLGMTDEMALYSLGKSSKINSSVGSWGTHEQWIYYNIYRYFENGTLKSYPNSK